MSTSSPSGNPEDALKTIASTAVAEANRTAQGQADPLASAAFALGWQMQAPGDLGPSSAAGPGAGTA